MNFSPLKIQIILFTNKIQKLLILKLINRTKHILKDI